MRALLAPTEPFQWIAALLAVLGGSVIYLSGARFDQAPDLAPFSLGFCFAGAAVGLWFAHEWARIVAALLVIALGVAMFATKWTRSASSIEFSDVYLACGAIGIGIFLLLPSTRALFRDARDRRAAARTSSS